MSSVAHRLRNTTLECHVLIEWTLVKVVPGAFLKNAFSLEIGPDFIQQVPPRGGAQVKCEQSEIDSKFNYFCDLNGC
jgi:hypothetical protein